MPILGSFGTANERAYGFGDSSFTSSLYLPPSITDNAELIYDASNPESVRTTNTYGSIFYVYNPDSVIYGSYWFVGLPVNSNVLAGDSISNIGSGFGATVIAVNKNVSMTVDGVTKVGDQVVIDTRNAATCPATAFTYSVAASSTTWYDISGNNRNATLGGTPTLVGTGTNQYFTFTNTNNASVPSVFDTPAGGGNTYFVYYFVADITDTNAIASTDAWGTKRWITNSEIFFNSLYGGGSATQNGDYDPSGWRLFRVEVYGNYTDNYYFFSSLTSCTTTIGGQTGYSQGSGNVPTNGKRTYSSLVCKDGTAMKFMSLYSLDNDPGLTTVYNALKGRFGL